VIYGVVTAWPMLRIASIAGIKAVLLAVTDALRAPVPAAALWPVRAVLEPVLLLALPLPLRLPPLPSGQPAEREPPQGHRG
jgi:hypothetical protein